MRLVRRIALASVLIAAALYIPGMVERGYDTAHYGLGNTFVKEALAQVGCVPNPNAAGPPFTNGCPIPASGLNMLANAVGVGLPQVSTTSALQAMSASAFTKVARLGFNTQGDTPALMYSLSNSPCSLNGGAGDNGWQVQVSGGGKCWIATFPNYGVEVGWWGASPSANGSTNSTAINAAINAVQTFTGGMVRFGAGTYAIGSTLTITASNVTLEGINPRATVLSCATGASDCIDILGVSTSSQIFGDFIRKMRITQTSLTGAPIGVRFAGQGGIESAVIDQVLSPTFFSGINDERVRDVYFNMSASATGPALKFDSVAVGERSDVLTLDHVTIQGASSGQDCMVWDGYTNTLRLFGVNMLGCANGLHIEDTSGSTSQYPQFLQADDLEVDSATGNALVTDSYAASLTIVNSQLTTTGSTSAFSLGAHTGRVYFLGDRLQGSYGGAIAGGASDVIVVGDDFNGSTTAALNDPNGIATVVGGFDFNGSPLSLSQVGSHTIFNGTKPAVSSCGTSPSNGGVDGAGEITAGSGTVTSCVLTFAATWGNAPFCVATSTNPAVAVVPNVVSATAVTFDFSTSAPGMEFFYHCQL